MDRSGQGSQRDRKPGAKLEPRSGFLAWALRRLGYLAAEARDRIERALDHLEGLGKSPTDEKILKHALARR